MILVIGGKFQGKKAFARQNWEGQTILEDLQEMIRSRMNNREEMEAFCKQLLLDPPAVITLDEVGCGIVPLEQEERSYRDLVGQIGQKLAARATEVYRVQCGIATRIK